MRKLCVITKKMAQRYNYSHVDGCPIYHALKNAGLQPICVGGLSYVIGDREFKIATIGIDSLGNDPVWNVSTQELVAEGRLPSFIFWHDDELGMIIPGEDNEKLLDKVTI